MAIVLIRKTGRPLASSAYGINDPNGNPCCFRDRVERLPMRPECINVRARSANEGSGTAGWPLVAPAACFPKDEEDIAEPSLGVQQITGRCLLPLGLGSRTAPRQGTETESKPTA